MNQEYHRAYSKTHYEKNKGYYIEKAARAKKASLDWLRSLKTECSMCGESETVCLDFHHTNPSEKELSLSRAVQMGWGKARLLAEIAKCRLVCSNCHRKIHARVVELDIHASLRN